MSTDGLCPDCKRPVERISEHNYFFKMGQYQDRLIEHIKQHPNFIRPESRRNEVLGFLTTQKLGDLSISRPKSSLSWGIELPFDKDYVTYVWFDALVNYVSALEYLAPHHHKISYWPATCPSGRKRHPHHPRRLLVHDADGAWTCHFRKRSLPTVGGPSMERRCRRVEAMSSIPNKMIDEFGADAFRYFLFREVPFGQDGDFSQSAMVTQHQQRSRQRNRESVEPHPDHDRAIR